jgi:hypothetical protein
MNVPHYKTTVLDMVYPDHEITPTLQDKIEGNDPEVQWIINDIKRDFNKELISLQQHLT